MVTAAARVRLKNQRAGIVWFTGLSGAGKSTLAEMLEERLNRAGLHTASLDGDDLRNGLNKDLGFSEQDRAENIRRASEVAKLMVDAGLIVLCTFISPRRADRKFARSLVRPSQFFEVFVDAPIEECIARDPKGIYRRALAGEICNVTGLDQVYEPPEQPEIHLKSAGADPESLVSALIDKLVERRVIKPLVERRWTRPTLALAADAHCPPGVVT
jgi:bifunctional enzyme CysN/CysC